MDKFPLVSILLPLYNAEKYFAETMESLISQTYPNKEIIVVDDGSTDRSLEIAKKYEKKYDYIKVYTQKNSGAAVARNKAFSYSKGEYIQYFDADDIMHPEKISLQIKALQAFGFDPEIVATGRWERFFYSLNNIKFHPLKVYRSYENSIDFLIESWTHAHYIIGQSWMIPRSLHNTVEGWNSKISVLDDGVFFAKVVYSAKKIVFVEESITYWRQDNAFSLSKNKSRKGMESHLLACDEYVEIVKDDLAYPRMKEALALEYSKFIYVAYPQYMDLIEKAEEAIVGLGFDSPLPLPTNKFRLFAKIIGFYPTARLFAAKDRLMKKIRLKLQ